MNQNDDILADFDAFLNALNGPEDPEDKLKEEKLDKFSKTTEKAIKEMIEEKKVLQITNQGILSLKRKTDIEIVGREFELLFEVTEEGKVKYDITGDHKSLEVESDISEEELIKKVKEFIQKKIQRQRIKNTFDPPKTYLNALVGFTSEFTDKIWMDLIKNYSNDEIETECFEILRIRKTKKMRHVTEDYTFLMLKVFDRYYAVSYNKETFKHKLVKSLNKEEAIRTYRDLIDEKIKEEAELLW